MEGNFYKKQIKIINMGESLPAVGLSDCFYFFGDMLSGILPIILAVFQMQFITLRLNLL